MHYAIERRDDQHSALYVVVAFARTDSKRLPANLREKHFYHLLDQTSRLQERGAWWGLIALSVERGGMPRGRGCPSSSTRPLTAHCEFHSSEKEETEGATRLVHPACPLAVHPRPTRTAATAQPHEKTARHKMLDHEVLRGPRTWCLKKKKGENNEPAQIESKELSHFP